MLFVVSLSWLLRLLFPVNTAPSDNSDSYLADTISWNTRRLTWDDFMGRPNPRYMNTVALTSSSINIFYRGYEHDPNITVTTTFYRRNSWVKDEGRNKHVLQHEQLHFDIAELHARKLRQRISRLPKSQRDWKTIQRLYDKANDECGDYQKRYDGATHHSVLKDVQQEWNARVAKELVAYDAYAAR